MPGSSFVSGGISLLGHYCFLPALKTEGKRTEVSLSQLPETSLSPQHPWGTGGVDIIQAQQLVRDYSLLEAHAQRGTEDGDSWSSTVGKQLGWAANLNTHPNPAQYPHFHLSFPFLRNSLEASGLQWLQQLLQLLWCLPLLGSCLFSDLYRDPQGFLRIQEKTLNFSLFSKDTVHHNCLTWKLEQDIKQSPPE